MGSGILPLTLTTYTHPGMCFCHPASQEQYFPVAALLAAQALQFFKGKSNGAAG